MFLGVALAAGVLLQTFSAGTDRLANYEPPLMTRTHAADGQLMAEYAAERRLPVSIYTVPFMVKAAFLSAEDKTFYEHEGLDGRSIVRAVLTNLFNTGSGKRLIGASTITQQVARNLFLNSEITYERKIKEALLALRIEQTYSKDKIFDLYLNEIYLGLGSYGVAAAALDYFGKPLSELNIPEAAYLAALPKAPENYNPFRHEDRAVERRNWVIDRMVENGYIRAADGEAAKTSTLTVSVRARNNDLFGSEYFAEEVRRNLVDLYGSQKVYESGLSVRTTLDRKLQVLARTALHDGLIKYDRSHGYRGPVRTIDVSGDWGAQLGEIPPLSDVPEWTLAVVLGSSSDGVSIGLQPPTLPDGSLSSARDMGVIPGERMKWARGHPLKAGDVIYAQAVAGQPGVYELCQLPEIEGAMMAMDPHTGRVLAMVGGFSFAESEFNRATQAWRQPGSSFKPFIYSAALDSGSYTPSSVILDAPITINERNEVWRPVNYGGKYLGPATLRTGIEKSRNVMTVRLAQAIGMPLIVDYAKRFGIYDDLAPYLPMALGAGETTVLRLVTAYATIANGGRKINATLIDRIQDRFGHTIYRSDQRECDGCDADAWAGQDEPTLVDTHDQVLDPMTAYQITSMMEGVVQRGTATVVQQVGKPIAGKTGTTSDEKDAWFIGFSPDLVCGVFIGYDKPTPMGKGMTGGVLAAPIFTEFMKVALKDAPPKEFEVPPGIELIPIDRRTGVRAEVEGDGVILEAYKPGQAPTNDYAMFARRQSRGQTLMSSAEDDTFGDAHTRYRQLPNGVIIKLR